MVRVLISARREKHMETRVCVERKKAENWLAREVLRHWRRTRKKQAHVSYLPIWGEGRVAGGTPTAATETVAVPNDRAAQYAGGKRDADCKSAIRQVENLRYRGVGTPARVDTAWHHP